MGVFFVESIANLRFLRFLLFPLPLLSETSFWSHFSSIFDVKNRSKPFPDGCWKNDDFLITFFLRFGRFWVPLGGPRGPLGGAIFAPFLHFWGSRRQICPCMPLLGPVWMIFGDLVCFQVSFFDVFSVFFWYTLWYFFPMILTLIRATEEKLIDR